MSTTENLILLLLVASSTCLWICVFALYRNVCDLTQAVNRINNQIFATIEDVINQKK